MAKKDSFSEDWLLKKGFTPNASGGFDPPKFIHKTDLSQPNLIQKEKIVETNDFNHAPVTEWFIPYQTPSKKNSRITFTNKKTGKVVNIPSKAYAEYKNVTKMYWTIFGKEFKRTIATLDLKFPLNIEMTFVRKTNQLVDYFGPGESVFDLMTDFGWWEDDNRRFGKPFFGDMEVDKNKPGVKIKILL